MPHVSFFLPYAQKGSTVHLYALNTMKIGRVLCVFVHAMGPHKWLCKGGSNYSNEGSTNVYSKEIY